MSSNSIDAQLMARMFQAGARNLEAKKEWINELNVFPVPDGDTGTNMTLTIMSAADELKNLDNVSLETVSKAISSGSLRGARGNSGVILSQLFRGCSKVWRNESEINAENTVRAFQKAVETAYKAVMKPKEGTILTVAKGGAEKVRELVEKNPEIGIEDLLRQTIDYMEIVLNQTPEMLPVLKEAGVVDSGGQGLVQIMKGCLNGYLGIEEEEAGEVPEVVYAYYAEFIVKSAQHISKEDRLKFVAFLESMGGDIAAEQAQNLTHEKKIVVIPTRTIPQGIAALVNYMPEKTPAENEAAMREEIYGVKTVELTYAVRDTKIEDKTIHSGDIMGVGDNGIIAVGTDIEETAMDSLTHMIEDDSELISVYYGKEISQEDADKLADRIREKFPDCEVEVNPGGQPIYYYILSVE